jgi:hypothetical protein
MIQCYIDDRTTEIRIQEGCESLQLKLDLSEGMTLEYRNGYLEIDNSSKLQFKKSISPNAVVYLQSEGRNYCHRMKAESTAFVSIVDEKLVLNVTIQEAQK